MLFTGIYTQKQLRSSNQSEYAAQHYTIHCSGLHVSSVPYHIHTKLAQWNYHPTLILTSGLDDIVVAILIALSIRRLTRRIGLVFIRSGNIIQEWKLERRSKLCPTI